MNIRRAFAVLVLIAAAAGLGSCTWFRSELVARIDVSPVVVYVGENVELDGGASFGSKAIVSYSWDYDGKTVSGRTVTVSFATAGTYDVRLIVEDADGRTSSASTEVIVYLRSGSEIFFEDFGRGDDALGIWGLDPTWASEGDATVDFIAGGPGYALYIHSSNDRWHRRTTPIELPPLRVGQRAVFSCRIMTLQIESEHTFLFAPARRELTSIAGSLPYYQYSSNADGSYIREPTAYGSEIARPIGFIPDVYRWHTYTFSIDSDDYEFSVDAITWLTGPWSGDLSRGGEWLLLLGEESLDEACRAYYDDIRVTIEE